MISSWLMDDVHKLKKVMLLVEEAGYGKYGLTRLKIE